MTETMSDQTQATSDQDKRREIMRKHARLTSSGNLKFCHPTSREVAERQAAGRRPPHEPVIYDSIEAAYAAEAEMRELDGVQQRAYVCNRSRSGHAHLQRIVT